MSAFCNGIFNHVVQLTQLIFVENLVHFLYFKVFEGVVVRVVDQEDSSFYLVGVNKGSELVIVQFNEVLEGVILNFID